MTETLPAAYRARIRNDNWHNYSVLRHGAFDGMLVTSKNSGTHWLKYMLAIAIADTHGIARPKYFSENAVRPYIGWPKDKPVFPQIPRLAFSHTIPHRLTDWGWARRLAGLPPYVLAVRHPMAILASHHAKWEYDIQVDWLTYLQGDPAGKQYRCDIYWLARFWNRWGDVRHDAPDLILNVHYEETLKDARAVLEAVAAHWSLDLAPDAIDAALDAGTKEEMAKHTDPDAEPNVLQNRKTSLDELFTGAAMDVYRKQARALFRHDLGYDLLTPPA
ncbi:sulfotransferase family protein [Hyphomonas sp.]|uniref:sulfotransferase family protein n=1 Tax=Hyphomonas sp. TaxID=87 RepID=UPI003D285EC4|tara:strand:- start:5748 stop:6572 length:825 start_codon:yes stop_codon:yes gene_type:complete